MPPKRSSTRRGDGQSRAVQKRAVPRRADMGELDGPTHVRVDPDTGELDVRDVLLLALRHEGAVKAASKALGAGFGVDASDLSRVKWVEGAGASHSRGAARLAARPAVCAAILKRARDARQKWVPAWGDELVDWLAEATEVRMHPEHVSRATASPFEPDQN